MVGWSPQCYIPSFLVIGPPVPEKKIFEMGFTIYGRGGHLGHVTSIMSTDFHFLVPGSFHKKMVAWRPSWSCDPDAVSILSSPYPRRHHIKFGYEWASGFGEEDV